MKTKFKKQFMIPINFKSKNRFSFKLLVLIFICIFDFFSFSTFAQNNRLSLNFKNKPLNEVLNEIELKSGYTFLVRSNDLNLKENITITVVNKDIEEVLIELFKKSQIKFEITGKNISIFKPQKYLKNSATSENRKISGKVIDANGDPIIGASVVIKGKETGAITDMNGVFSLEANDNTTLIISFIGYKTYEVRVGKLNDLTIKLLENTELLDEVVVVGYGVQKKSNVTGSVSSIKTSDFNNKNMSVLSAIQGRVAGVDVSNGSIIIRGAASINGSDPLWIVDGIPGSAPNMNDIETLEILKDAASTAIYGARGAGGVILATTKKGKDGKTTVNVMANVGVTTAIDIPTMLSTKDYIDRKLAAGFTAPASAGWDNPSSLPNTNWKDYVWRNAITQNYYVQVSGGNNKTTHNASAEFNNNQSLQKNAGSQSANLRYTGQTQFNSKFKVTEILSTGYSNTTPSLIGSNASAYSYYRQVPTMTPYDATNSSGGGWGMQPTGGYYNGPNLVGMIYSLDANYKSFYSGATLKFDLEIMKDLTLQANFTGNETSHANNTFQNYYNTGNVTIQQMYTKDYGSSYDLRMQYILTYKKLFAKKHDVMAMAGYEAYKSEATSAGGWKTGFSVEPSSDMSLGTGSSDASGSKSSSRNISQFARLNYAYDNKYLLETSVRRDGYDNFGPNKRYGIFPSLSAGWNITKESFISENSHMDWLSQLKLRGSLGKIGNNTVSQFLYEPAYTSNYLYYSYDSQSTSRGFWYQNIPNKSIKWEDVTQWNVAMDASFFNNKLSTTIEYYNKETTDMLYTIGAPPSSGAYSNGTSPSYVANIGEINNHGFEFSVQWKDSYKDFKYDIGFTAYTNKNKVIKLSNEINPQIYQGTSVALAGSIYQTQNGQAMGLMYGYIAEGIFKNQSQIDALNAKSPTGVYQSAGTAPGDLIYKDVNGDGKITSADKTVIGNPWPKITYGLNMNMSWKGFDLSLGWMINIGGDIFNEAKAYERNFYGDYNSTYKIYDAWSTANTNSSNPRVISKDPNGNFTNVSSYFIEDGSYLKLKNLHFGYNLPKYLLSSLKISGLNIYVNCTNLFMLTKFQGDPEIGGAYLSRNLYSNAHYPNSRSIVGGISVNF